MKLNSDWVEVTKSSDQLPVQSAQSNTQISPIADHLQQECIKTGNLSKTA